jgi:hypothetical protein
MKSMNHILLQSLQGGGAKPGGTTRIYVCLSQMLDDIQSTTNYKILLIK